MPRPFAAYAPRRDHGRQREQGLLGRAAGRLGARAARPDGAADQGAGHPRPRGPGHGAARDCAAARGPGPDARRHRARLREQRDGLVAAVRAALPDWTFRVPAGGLSLWCELPGPGRGLGIALADEAERHGVIIVAPGPVFAPDGGLDRFVRIPWTRRIDELERPWPASQRHGRSCDPPSTATPVERPRDGRVESCRRDASTEAAVPVRAWDGAGHGGDRGVVEVSATPGALLARGIGVRMSRTGY